jgi:hypothetical protein
MIQIALFILVFLGVQFVPALVAARFRKRTVEAHATPNACFAGAVPIVAFPPRACPQCTCPHCKRVFSHWRRLAEIFTAFQRAAPLGRSHDTAVLTPAVNCTSIHALPSLRAMRKRRDLLS